jgi:hypothetical protein
MPRQASEQYFLVALFGLIWLQTNSRSVGVITHDRRSASYSVRVTEHRALALGHRSAFCIAFIVVMIVLPMAVLFMGTFMKAFGYSRFPNHGLSTIGLVRFPIRSYCARCVTP